MVTVPLNETGSVVLNGSGNGTAKVGPLSARETWRPSNVHVGTFQATNTVVNEATCKIYVGDQAIQQNYRDLTFTGSSGDSSDAVGGSTVKAGQFVWAVWTGGDPGVTAAINVTGEKDI